ncbi:hypothetical protein SELMODRAFT_442891, partial [Selaginella moellendorffii]
MAIQVLCKQQQICDKESSVAKAAIEKLAKPSARRVQIRALSLAAGIIGLSDVAAAAPVLQVNYSILAQLEILSELAETPTGARLLLAVDSMVRSRSMQVASRLIQPGTPLGMTMENLARRSGDGTGCCSCVSRRIEVFSWMNKLNTFCAISYPCISTDDAFGSSIVVLASRKWCLLEVSSNDGLVDFIDEKGEARLVCCSGHRIEAAILLVRGDTQEK